MTALIGNLGPFLSPHLPAVLHLLLDTRLLHPAIPVYPLAAKARGRLCGAVPARLLLPALIHHLDTAIKVGPRSDGEAGSPFFMECQPKCTIHPVK